MGVEKGGGGGRTHRVVVAQRRLAPRDALLVQGLGRRVVLRRVVRPRERVGRRERRHVRRPQHLAPLLQALREQHDGPLRPGFARLRRVHVRQHVHLCQRARVPLPVPFLRLRASWA